MAGKSSGDPEKQSNSIADDDEQDCKTTTPYLQLGLWIRSLELASASPFRASVFIGLKSITGESSGPGWLLSHREQCTFNGNKISKSSSSKYHTNSLLNDIR